MNCMRRLWFLVAITWANAVSACTGMPNLNKTPDRPINFGYKVNWFAVKAKDPATVAAALDIGPGIPSNWASGMAAAYGDTCREDQKQWIFISPPVNGWIFVIGSHLPYPVMHTPDRHGGIGQQFDSLFSRLNNHFPEVQFFGSYRVVGFVAWARAKAGKIERVFSFGDGDVYANIGKQSREEASLAFQDLSGLSPSAASERIFGVDGKLPDESDVLRLSNLWSIDPENLSEKELPEGLGLVVQLPESSGK